MKPQIQSPNNRGLFWLLTAVSALIALLPWWRNHNYLRDFYDYGLFINVNARLLAGQHPYLDFSTPAQTAAFLLNFAAEKLGGGTYLGLTYGAAALILAGVIGLAAILVRRWPMWLAFLLVAAVICGSATQHTIIFYNPIGVLTLALVTWSFAVAPLLRRDLVGWHVVAAVGLLLGGMNKLNFHAIGVAMALGWILRGAIKEKAGFLRVAGTLLFLFTFGLVLPVVFEMAWTGAGPHRWYHNVIALPLQARGGRISLLSDFHTYFNTLHGYYGDLRVPQVGLLSVLLPLPLLFAAWRREASWSPWLGPVFLAMSVLAVVLSTLALLLTNNEIAYVTFAAGLVLVTSLWLGFSIIPRGWLGRGGIIFPAAVLLVFGTESAWQGQRSQFGHSKSLRESYLNATLADPDFLYLDGLYLPPETVSSLKAIANRRIEFSPELKQHIYYGPGAEWLEHIWPVKKIRGMSLVPQAFDGPREKALFEKEVLSGGTFQGLIDMEAWDHWEAAVDREFAHSFSKEKIGSLFYLYRRLQIGVLSGSPIEYNPGIGGNADPSQLLSDMKLVTTGDGRNFLGTTKGEGKLQVLAASYRISGEAVLKRTKAKVGEPISAWFKIYAGSGAERYPRWQAELTLPNGKDEIIVPTEVIDSSGLPVECVVTVPAELADKVVAGWRGPKLLDTVDLSDRPPLLQAGSYPLTTPSRLFGASMLPPVLQERPLLVRNSWLRDAKCYLPAGGEVWIKLNGIYSRIRLVAESDHADGRFGNLRIIFYKGGRLETFHPHALSNPRQAEYLIWSPERDGWLGILADTNAVTPGYTVKILEAVKP